MIAMCDVIRKCVIIIYMRHNLRLIGISSSLFCDRPECQKKQGKIYITSLAISHKISGRTCTVQIPNSHFQSSQFIYDIRVFVVVAHFYPIFLFLLAWTLTTRQFWYFRVRESTFCLRSYYSHIKYRVA